MQGAFHANGTADISDPEVPEATHQNSSVNDINGRAVTLTSGGRGRCKVRQRVILDRRPPFAPNESKLNRESPGAWGSHNSAVFAPCGPAWVSRADFFSDAISFGNSNEIKEIKSLSISTAAGARSSSIGRIFFRGQGKIKGLRNRSRDRPARGTNFFGHLRNLFFLPPRGIKSLASSIADRWARSKNSAAKLAEYFSSGVPGCREKFIAKFRVGGVDAR